MSWCKQEIAGHSHALNFSPPFSLPDRAPFSSPLIIRFIVLSDLSLRYYLQSSWIVLAFCSFIAGFAFVTSEWKFILSKLWTKEYSYTIIWFNIFLQHAVRFWNLSWYVVVEYYCTCMEYPQYLFIAVHFHTFNTNTTCYEPWWSCVLHMEFLALLALI